MSRWFLLRLQAFNNATGDGSEIHHEVRFKVNPIGEDPDPVTIGQADDHARMVLLPSLPEAWHILEFTVQPARTRRRRPLV